VEQALFMQLFSKLTYPASYSKHISFLDFDRFQRLAENPNLSSLMDNKESILLNIFGQNLWTNLKKCKLQSS
jgi:hypothetical protein